MSSLTTLPKVQDLERQRRWFLADAADQVLGRLASRIASVLMGKHKRLYVPSLDCGDFVVVTNAAKIRLTGDKLNQKTYFRHSGYASGAKIIPMKRQMEKNPARVMELAVKRMLAKNKLRAHQLRRLKVFAGPEHPFQFRKMENL